MEPSGRNRWQSVANGARRNRLKQPKSTLLWTRTRHHGREPRVAALGWAADCKPVRAIARTKYPGNP
jgi:hypothetical protein